MAIVTMIVYTVILLSVLIFAHELGHFMACRILGVKVNEFALGMGPALFKRQPGETTYSLRAFPIGGFCAMEGEDEDEESEDARSFTGKPGWAKAIILVAGSLMNVLLAVLILAGLLLYNGTATTTIKEVVPGSPAYAANLMPGDRITAIDGAPIGTWNELLRAIATSDGETITIQAQRGGEPLMLESAVMADETGRKVIGIRPEVVHNPFTALVGGAQESVRMVGMMVDLIGQLFTGAIPTTELTGPVGIAYIVGDTAQEGMRYVVFLAALISLNLAIVNMLPFPALDGGRLLFLVIRAVTGKAITDNIESKVHLIGLMLLFALMIYVTWNDIGRFILGRFG